MKPMRLSEIATLLGGELQPAGAASERATGVAIDSRRAVAGDLFFAIEAARDGHDYIANAREAGAIAAVVRRERAGEFALPVIAVDDPRRALGRFAAETRKSQATLPTVAITGSLGKTTTCGYVAALLAPLGGVHRPPGSFNNDLGVPLTILGAPPETRALVLELGTNAPGEIAPLAEIARPQVGVVTAIEPVHLEQLGDLDGVTREKLSLITALPPGARAWVPVDVLDSARRAVRADAHVSIEAFGVGGASEVSLRSGGRAVWRFRGDTHEFAWTPKYRHQCELLAVAFAVAMEYGLAPAEILARVSTLPEPPLRGETRRIAGIEFILDCYNSSPAALRASLDRLEDERALGRRICVLGTMEELGREEERWHRELGRRAGTGSIDRVFLAGRGRGWFREGLREVGRDAVEVEFGEDGARTIARCLLPGDRVLFKASRTERLEEFAERIGQFITARVGGAAGRRRSHPPSGRTS